MQSREFAEGKARTNVASEFLSNSRMKMFPVQNVVYITFLEHACGLLGKEQSSGRIGALLCHPPLWAINDSRLNNSLLKQYHSPDDCIKAAQVS